MQDEPLTVYWSTPNNNSPFYLNIQEPVPLINELLHHKQNFNQEGNNFFRCPSFHQSLSNKFLIKSPINYDLIWDGKTFQTKSYNQDFFDRYISIREIEIGLASIQIFSHTFFCEEDLEMEVYPAYLSNSQFATKTILIPGKYNIGKWFRPLDITFIVNEKNNQIIINENDSLMYVKFHTNRPIQFKKFYFNQTISEIQEFCLNQKHFQYNKNIKTYLHNIYHKFKMSKLKKLLIKEIKSNLME